MGYTVFRGMEATQYTGSIGATQSTGGLRATQYTWGIGATPSTGGIGKCTM